METGGRTVAVAGFILMFVVQFDLVVVTARPQTVERGRSAPSVTLVAVDIVISHERERMHEGCGGPGNRIVALFAVLGEVQGYVVGPARKVVRVACVAVRGKPLESPPCMTQCAIRRGMCSCQREEIVFEVRPGPTGGSMASLAVGCPAVGGMIWAGGPDEIPLVAELTLQRSAPVLADGSLKMAALAGRHGVSGNQVKTCAGVLGDESRRRPVQLPVAVLAIKPERRGMWIRVTTPAAASEICRDRSPVIVAPETNGRSVRPLEGVAGLGCMVEREVLPDYIPAVGDVADSAVARKSAVRNKRAPLFVPALLRD